jgi:hypothetical protein
MPKDIANADLPDVGDVPAPIETVIPPIGWSPEEDGDVDAFITLCYNYGTANQECGSTDNPGSLDKLKDKYEKDTANTVGDPPPVDPMAVDLSDKLGVEQSQAQAFLDLTHLTQISDKSLQYSA